MKRILLAAGLALSTNSFAVPEAGPATARNPVAPASQTAVPRFGFVTMGVKNLDRSLAFYKAVFGMTEQFRADYPETTEVGIDFPHDPNGPHLILMQPRSGKASFKQGGALQRFSVFVKDIEQSCKLLVMAGGKITQKPYEISEAKVKVAFVSDIDGNTVELLQPTQ